MNKIFIIAIIVANFSSLGAQKNDYVWLLGNSVGSLEPGLDTFGTTIIDFNGESAPSFSKVNGLGIGFYLGNSSISDSLGNLQFYSNGSRIFNKAHQLMENGDGFYESSLNFTASPIMQGVLSLPFPEHPNLYGFFYVTEAIYLTDDISVAGWKIFFSIVDISLNNGLGAVIEKNIELINDTLDVGKLTAMKHGNGRDWWILVPEYATPGKITGIYKILFTPDGIRKISKQEVEISYQTGAGQNIFSPDGKKYIIYGTNDLWEDSWLNIFDFDRCTGELSNQLLLRVPRAGNDGGSGTAISSNSRFLYVVGGTHLIQYDLKASDIQNSMQIIGVWDNFYSPPNLKILFYYCQLAPDGKIYISSNSSRWLHVIHEPNLLGEDCQFEQRAILIPTYNHLGIPNFPNFRLHNWIDSPCDTLSQDTVVSSVSMPNEWEEVRIYPNPVQVGEQLQIEPADWTVTAVYDVYGRVVSHNNTLPDLPGMYWVILEKNGRKLTRKVVVQRE